MSHTYTVEATRSGKWWVLEEPTLGCVSQVRRLSEVADEMREAIAHLAQIDEREVVIKTRIILPDPVAERVDQIEALREESRRANAAAARESRELVSTMRMQGFTLDDIGMMLGVSKGRVSQLANNI